MLPIAVDAMGGDHWRKGYRCLAPTGRLVVFGFSNAATGKTRSIVSFLLAALKTPWFSFPPPRLMNDNKALIGVNLGHMWDQTELLAAWLRQLLAWRNEGKIHPTVGARFPLAEASAAHHYIQDRKNVGEVVLVP